MQTTRNTLSILGVTNEKYFPYLLVLVRSVVRNMPHAHIRTHLINISDEMAETLRAVSPHIEITREKVDASEIMPSLKATPDMYPKLLAAYCENRRASLMEEMLLRGDPYIFYLDADAIVRKSLDGLVHLLQKSDGLLLRQASVHRVTGGDRNRFAGGALAFRNTELSRAFVSRWSALVTGRVDDRFANQECLAPAYDEYAGSILIHDLPFRFIDWKLSFGSPVWIGKGPVVDSRMYKLEAERYLKDFNFFQTILATLEQFVLRISRAVWELKNASFAVLGNSLKALRGIFGAKKKNEE